MKPLDVVNSVDFGYRLVWAERRYLTRLAAIPVLIKLLTIALVIALGWPEEALRSTIISLPSLFAYGWMLSHLSRLVFYGQYWPFRPTGDAVADGVMLQDRAQGVSAGTLFFVVAYYLFAGLDGIILFLIPAEKIQQMTSGVPPTSEEPSMMLGFAALAFVVFSLWAARFMFLYIPAAAGLSVRPIVRARQGMLISLQMIGIGLVCLIPVMLVAKWLLTIMIAVFVGDHSVSPGLLVLVNTWFQLAITIAQLILTASIAHGIKTMMREKVRL